MSQLARDQDAGTYLCGLDHPHILQSIPMQMTMGQSSDRLHFILESQCVRCCCVIVYVRYYTCKSITTQHRSLPQGCLRVVGGFAGSKIVTPTPTCGHPYL